MLADKFLKDGDFVKARAEVGHAQKLDPSNPYAYAFLDRITYFEEQVKKKEAHKKDAEEAEKRSAAEEEKKKKDEEEKARLEEEVKRKQEEEAKRKAHEEEEKRRREEDARRKAGEEERKKTEEVAKRKAEEEAKRRAVEEARKRVEVEANRRADEAKKKAEEAGKKEAEERQKAGAAGPAVSRNTEETGRQPAPAKPSTPKAGSMIEAARPLIAEMLAARPKPDSEKPPSTPAIADILQQVSQSASAPKGDVDVKLEEMRRQIEMLTRALDQERKVREEMNQFQIKGAIKQLRSALEKAWVNGVPKDSDISLLHEMAASLGIPEDVVQTLTREVKLDMYARAVKEVVSKQKLLRNSSRTLEWLRNVYKVTIDEYLEYESKFLLDLVADQYKGTILLVTGDEKVVKELGQRLKSTGYAVVNAESPENALEKIEKINPHYVLCDMEFAGGALSGIKFLHVLRASSKFSFVPFIMLCQTSEVTQLRSSELRPTEGYVEKPIEIEKLNLVMNEKLAAFRQYLSSL